MEGGGGGGPHDERIWVAGCTSINASPAVHIDGKSVAGQLAEEVWLPAVPIDFVCFSLISFDIGESLWVRDNKYEWG
jgi:hypothetical protein